jgi:hypothetical protein
VESISPPPAARYATLLCVARHAAWRA